MGWLHVATSEAHQIAIADVRADGDAAQCRFMQHAIDPRRIAGMKTAGNIRARHDVEHRRIVAHPPGAEALTEIAVQINA